MSTLDNIKIGVIITVWKRQHLEKQLIQLSNQTIKPDYIVVFQNENHINVVDIVKKYKVIHVKSDYNTKFFGRFSYFFNLPVDICVAMDDDIIPGINCIKNYVEQCIKHNAIIGGNGRYSHNNPNNRPARMKDVGKRTNVLKVDFVGHLWCFKKDWLYYMFSAKPYTYETGEDMHFCFTCKLYGNISCYVGAQINKEDECDITNNSLADDQHSSFKISEKDSHKLRKEIQTYWHNKGVKYE